MNTDIFTRVDNYISSLLAPEDTALTDVVKSIEAEGLPFHSITANQGKFLQVMMIACNAKNVLELGTLAGYSTIWLARALPENGKVVSIEVDQHHGDVAKRNIENAGLTKKVDIRIGSALDILPKLIADNHEPFDMIFVDADKPPYAEYFQFALKLSRPGTLIIFDNVIREGKVLDDCEDDKVLGVQRLNKLLGENPKITATILQTVGVKEHDGIAIVVVNRNN